MAISATGDILMDVLRAADPEAAESARLRLQRMAAGAAGETFPAPPATTGGHAATVARASSEPDPYAKFEAMVLGSFIQTMLPQEAASVYGDGFAGETWKSMLAEQLGEAMAARGGIGIANRLLADRYRDGEAVVALAGVNDGPARATRDGQARMSTALVQELQRRMMQSLGSESSGASAFAAKPGDRT